MKIGAFNISWFLLLSILSTSYSVYGQLEAEWGKIPSEELQMALCTSDSNAHAMVLHESGHLRMQSGRTNTYYTLSYYRRVKLFDDKGFEYADVSVPYRHKNGSENVYNIKGRITLPSGGFINLEDEHFYTNKLSENYSELVFAFPGLESGAVIEYSYILQSEGWSIPRTWYFQHDIPCQKSVYKFENDSYATFVSLLDVTGGLDAGIQTDQLNMLEKGKTTFINRRDYFVMENAPAIRPEEYITSMDNYRTRVRFQVSETNFPNDLSRKILSSWEQCGKDLINADYFGDYYRKRRKYKAVFQEIAPVLAACKNEREKAQAIYYYIAGHTRWNGSYDAFPDKAPKATFETSIGSSADLSMALLALLNEAGLEAHPVLISTRSNGKMTYEYPIMEQFNHLLCYVLLDGVPALLDSPQTGLPFGLLMQESLNYKGWMVKKDATEWILINGARSAETAFFNIELQEDGTIRGNLQHRCENYRALRERREVYENNTGNFWQGRLPEGAVISDFENRNLKNIDEPLISTFAFEMPGGASVINDFIYCSPNLYTFFEESPFKLPYRYYPVEFTYPIAYTSVVQIAVPEGYVLEETPESLEVSFGSSGGAYSYQVMQNGPKINITQSLNISQMVYPPSQYSALREAFSAMIQKQKEQIVLRKKS
jgi:hypothetical protein